MAKQDKQKMKFELTQFNPDQIIDFSEWEQRQQKLLAENPFIETTPETYEEAKRRRTALRTGRTSLQNERDAVKKELNGVKKFVVDKYDEFIQITTPAEEKQQESVKEYEAILEAEKEKEKLAEEKRVNDIRALIDGCESTLDTIVLKMTFETIDESQQQFDATVDSGEYDDEVLQEFEFLFSEMVERQQQKFDERVKQVKEDHLRAVQELETQQKAKVDEMFRNATELIDSMNPDNVVDVKEKVHKLFETQFDFGKFKDQFESVAHRMFQKLDREMLQMSQQAIEREKQQRENELTVQKNRIIEVREGLLDLVFQMTADNFPEEKKKIRAKLTPPEKLFPELQDEWKKMTERVDHSMKQKLEVLANELSNREKEKEIRTEKRIQEIEKMGMIEIGEKSWGFKDVVSGFYWEKINSFTDEQFKDHVDWMLSVKAREDRKAKLIELGFDTVEDSERLNLNDAWIIPIADLEKMTEDEFKQLEGDVEIYKDENREMNARWDARKPQLNKLGFTEETTDPDSDADALKHKNFDLYVINDVTVSLTDEDWADYLKQCEKDVQECKANDKAEKARQKKLKADKAEIVDFINHSVRKKSLNLNVKEKESKEWADQMFAELNEWCDVKILQLENL